MTARRAEGAEEAKLVWLYGHYAQRAGLAAQLTHAALVVMRTVLPVARC